MLSLLQQILPIPNLREVKTIVCVGPHPDDIEIGMGASIAKLRESGIEFIYVIVTDGGAGTMQIDVDVSQLIEKRKKEAKESAKVVGIKELLFLDFPDGGGYHQDALVKKLVETLVPYTFEAIFTPNPSMVNEIHPDHLLTGNAVKETVFYLANPMAAKRRGFQVAFRRQEVILGFYFSHQNNYFMDLDANHLQVQQQMITKHQSQYPENHEITSQLFTYLTIQKQMNGIKIHTNYADGFTLIGPIQQHAYPEWNHYELK